MRPERIEEGAVPTSFFGTADLRAVEAALLGARSTAAGFLAALRQQVVSGRGQPGADLVVLGNRTLGPPAPGELAVPEGRALAVAYGAAAARVAHAAPEGVGSGRWVWCVLRPSALDDGRTWEAARAAARAGLRTLAVIVAAGSEHGSAGDDLEAPWRAAGWSSVRVDAADAWSVVSGLDRARATTHGPVALVAASLHHAR